MRLPRPIDRDSDVGARRSRGCQKRRGRCI